MDKNKLIFIIGMLILLTSCQNNREIIEPSDYQISSEIVEPSDYESSSEVEEPSDYENDTDYEGLSNEPLDEIDEDEVSSCVQLIEGDEEMNIYDICWRDVIDTEEGRRVNDLYRELARTDLPRHHMSNNITLGELKESIERSLETCEIEVLEIGDEIVICDSGPFLEVAGIQPAIMWARSERYRTLASEYRAFTGGELLLDEEPGRFSPITIDDLERAIRRSIEDGVNYVDRAILHGEFVDQAENEE